MHTTIQTESTTIGTTGTKPRRVSLFVALLALTISLLGGLVAGAAPASAATTGNVSFCLRYANGTAYANKPVNLYWAAPGGTTWNRWKSGSTNSAGCATWASLPTGYHYATQGYWTYAVGSSGYYYNGWTGSAWLGANGGTVTQATGSVGGAYRLY